MIAILSSAQVIVSDTVVETISCVVFRMSLLKRNGSCLPRWIRPCTFSRLRSDSCSEGFSRRRVGALCTPCKFKYGLTGIFEAVIILVLCEHFIL